MTNEETKRVLASNVRRLMEKEALSCRQLAQRTGDSYVTIHRLLHADHVPGIGIVTRVASALDTSVDYLLKNPDEVVVSA